jgi:hypothetical protein
LSDFETFSFTEITNVLEALDDKLNGNLNAVIVDYIQLCKFSTGGAHLGDDNRIINSYIDYFRKLAQSFRSGKDKKRLVIILLAQINRTSWEEAKRRRKDGTEGHYDLTCLADANELERGANRVFTTYTSERMKTAQEAQVQLLKNRGGETMWEPEKVYADPEKYIFGEELESFGQSITVTISQNNLMDFMSAMDTVTNSAYDDIQDLF